MSEPTPTITIGVDPGQASGVAGWRDDELRYLDTIDVDPIDPRRRLEILIQVLRACGVATHGNGAIKAPQVVAFACEDQFLGMPKAPKDPKKGKAKPPAAMFGNIGQVVRSGACWQTCAKLLGLVILPRVPPQVWRARYGIRGRNAEEKKKAAIRIVREALRKDGRERPIDADTAEAVLLTLDRHRRRQPDGVEITTALARTWSTP